MKTLAVAVAMSVTAALAPADAAPFASAFVPRPPGELTPTSPPLPLAGSFPVQLVYDDGVVDGDFGVLGGGFARQFLWLNRFDSPGPFELQQVWVLFSPGQNMSLGAAIQLVVYHDDDDDPTNGADLLATFDETITALDGTTFSIYDLAPSVEIPEGGSVLIGVVSRFVESGVTPPTFPAAVDTTDSQQSSWIAIWSGDPPATPELPADGAMLLLDDALPGLAGNWMIRGFGTPQPGIPIIEVPALDASGLAALTLLLALGAIWRLRRGRRPAPQGLER